MAMVCIRVIMIKPTESFIKVLREFAAGWQARISLTIYVDDGVLVTTGGIDAVTMVHRWACRMLLQWVERVLRKQTAEGKLQVITSTPTLRRRLGEDLQGMGYQVVSFGEIFGMDFAPGGDDVRRSQAARLRKGLRRKGRIRWLRANGGRASRVVRDGLCPGVNYEASVSGISDMALNLMRRAQGTTCRVRCGGTSLTTRLAVGAEDKGEADTGVLDCTRPVAALLRKVWDEPRHRSELVPMWRRAAEEVGGARESQRWRQIRGMAGATLAHLLRIGGEWHRPFAFRRLGHEVDILSTPPKQVVAIMRRQAREHYDRAFLARAAKEHGWDAGAVEKKYPHGIDWDQVRRILRGREGNLDVGEIYVYDVLVSGGLWTEERRWLAGYSGHGTCSACHWAIGSLAHKVVGCDALAPVLAEQRALGRIARWRQNDWEDGLEPLRYLGLPPLMAQIAPAEVDFEEGYLTQGWDGPSYGDGSGLNQNVPECRIATWAVIRQADESGEADAPALETLRGRVGGWFGTVAR